MLITYREEKFSQNFVAYFWLGIYACVVALAGSALNRFGVNTPLWYLIYVIVFMSFIHKPIEFLKLLSANQFQLLLAYFAIISCAWSILPARSFIASLQLLMSLLIGMHMGSRLSIREIFFVFWGAIGLCITLSFLNLTGAIAPNFSAVGGFLGIYTSKNLFAQHLGLFCIITLTYLFLKPTKERIILIVMLVLALIAAITTKSITSIFTMGFFSLIIIAVHGETGSNISRFSFRLSLLLAGIIWAILLINLSFSADEFLDQFGKSSSLTGRTDLWQVAWRHVHERPFLGMGYGAYWQHENYANEIAIMRADYGEAINGFHNFILEALVAFGLIGLLPVAIFCAVPFFRLWSLLRVSKDKESFSIHLLACLMVPYFLVLGSFGPLLFRQHETSIILLCALSVAAKKELKKQSFAS